MQFLIWIFSGVIAGWLAGLFGPQAVRWPGNVLAPVVVARTLRRA